ncbi:MAG: CHAD domain-containing protein [Sulfuricurvum sp.]|nr:CHAD domain-containing protein [Sulfuricurvum sp.]
MDNQHYLKKLKKFKKYVKSFVNSRKSGHKEIHSLRVISRELHSLLSDADPFYDRVKKVIKISNKIRDTDVFFEFFLPSLPKKYRNKLEIESIRKYTNKSRKKKIKKLHIYLKSLVVPKSVLFTSENDELNFVSGEELRLDKTQLHKYRIYLKKILAKEKNSVPKNETKIEILTKVKDILGMIHDHYNGLERLNLCDVNAVLLSKIKSVIQEKNERLYKRFKNLNREYIGSLA